jgi:integrase
LKRVVIDRNVLLSALVGKPGVAPAMLLDAVHDHGLEMVACPMAMAEVREITFHELRHTFGTQVAAAGAPLRAIQEWMGHADAKTTEIYRHYAPDPSNGAAFVERAFGGGALS